MRGKANYYPKEYFRNTFVQCSKCKKRGRNELFEDDDASTLDLFKCPFCAHLQKRLYMNKEEKELNKPIFEENKKRLCLGIHKQSQLGESTKKLETK